MVSCCKHGEQTWRLARRLELMFKAIVSYVWNENPPDKRQAIGLQPSAMTRVTCAVPLQWRPWVNKTIRIQQLIHIVCVELEICTAVELQWVPRSIEGAIDQSSTAPREICDDTAWKWLNRKHKRVPMKSVSRQWVDVNVDNDIKDAK